MPEGPVASATCRCLAAEADPGVLRVRDVTASEQVHGSAVVEQRTSLSDVKDRSQADQLPAVNDWLRCASDSLVEVDPLVQASNYWWARSDKMDNGLASMVTLHASARLIGVFN